ncbi:MAG TPA: HPr(Ser) kinase/phosphatase [Gammaproteobacteria bacterium]|jgi:HPr kinase/phosphorylase|nr:HPr(Ser) kinase/phosphatase [Pseudomonadota bacterium]HEX2237003.1 HPr(Ser) kinase/phosphatase [Gammaproteobacteria bacterium]
MTESLTVQILFEDLVNRLQLVWLAGKSGAERSFVQNSTARGNPGLVGHFNLIHANQVQVLGRTELTYLSNLRPNWRQDAYQQLVEGDPVVILLADECEPPNEILSLADRHQVPLLQSPVSSNELINDLRYYFTHKLADRVTLHGVFMEVLSIGVLLTGESGVGKSELALELITRGHRLVADDAPEFARIAPDIINGTCPALIQDFLEVRGLGVLNIRAMYGDSVIKKSKYLRLIIHLKHARPNDNTPFEDRLKDQQQSRNILGLDIPVFTLPVAPGRNLAVLVEAAVRNHLLRLNGYNAGEDLGARQRRLMG